MKYTIFFNLVFTLLCLIFSCKERKQECDFKGFSSSTSVGNHLDFSGYATHIEERVPDTINGGWRFDEKLRRIYFTEINSLCYEQAEIRILNIIPTEGDTVFLEPLVPIYAKGLPTAVYVSKDGDATKAFLGLLPPSETFSSWFLVDRIGECQRIRGQFELGFVVDEEFKERANSFNIPDTLLFINGVFESEFIAQ